MTSKLPIADNSPGSQQRLLFSAACGGGDGSPSADGIEIVVTTTVLGDIVENIVGSEASVEILMPTGADPHEFQASAQQAASIHKADLVVANGLGLEEGLNPVLSSAVDDGVRILNIGPSVDPLPLGSDPGSLDPHVWLDPIRIMTAVDVIVTELELLEPSIDWSTSGDNYKEELALLDWEAPGAIGNHCARVENAGDQSRFAWVPCRQVRVSGCRRGRTGWVHTCSSQF